MARLELVFPPLTGVNYPYLSTAVLKAYVEANSAHTVGQHDLNMALVDWLLRPETVRHYAARAQAALDALEGPALDLQQSLVYARCLDLTLQAESLALALPDALRVVRDPAAIHDATAIAAADRVISAALDAASAARPAERLNFGEPVWRYSASSPAELKAGIEDTGCLAHELCAQAFDPMLFEAADAVGLSVVYHGQVLPALCLAAQIKDWRPDLPIVVGGPFFTVHRQVLKTQAWLFDLIDAFVVFEGEDPLVGYLDCIDGAKSRAEVPGLIWRDDDGAVRESGMPVAVEVNKLPCPDFDGLPLDAYHLPEPTLPLLASRGCYWDCAFCTHHYIYGDSYRVRSRELIAEDLAAMRDRWGCRHVYFVDESLSPRLLRHISQASLQTGTDLRWGCELRAERSLTREDLDLAYGAGCRVFSFGIESANQRVLDSMNKGIKVEEIQRLLRDCREAGIRSHLMFIVGFPGETPEELDDSLEFVRRNNALIDLVGFSYFVLLRHSPVERKAADFGISRLQDLAAGLEFEERRAYDVNRGLGMSESFERWVTAVRTPQLQEAQARAGHVQRERFMFDAGPDLGAGRRLLDRLASAAIEVDIGGYDIAEAQRLQSAFLLEAGRRYNLAGETLLDQLTRTRVRIPALPRGAQFYAFNPATARSHVLDIHAARALARGELTPSAELVAAGLQV